MANIAQMINVLQAIILTQDEKMVLTPTYHVFDMYKVHQDATSLPISVDGGKYIMGRNSLPNVSATASVDQEGAIHISLVNINPKEAIEMSCDLRGTTKSKITYCQVITGATVGSFNTFEKPEEVKLTDLKGAKIEKGILKLKLPAASLVTVEIR
jgi:alpha-N-arabinofuranosidase